MIPLSVLDLSPIKQGTDAAAALGESAATAVAIAHVAAATSSIRVGAGGIMLPNHAPLVIAEQFGTLAALFPGRIDLGIGRAPGTDQRTALALRRHLQTDLDTFPRDVQELLAYLQPSVPGQAVRAIPGEGSQVPVWILGSSHYGAQLAAALGLPYAFASHFAPDDLDFAVELYRRSFRPSPYLDKPYVMLGLNVFAADRAEEAQLLFTSLQQAFVNLRRGHPGRLPPPDDTLLDRLSPADLHLVNDMLSYTVAGSATTVRRGLEEIVARTGADELMLASQIYDHEARLRSYQLAAGD
jgi:luciferase family oxidoreductase group 1